MPPRPREEEGLNVDEGYRTTQESGVQDKVGLWVMGPGLNHEPLSPVEGRCLVDIGR